MERDWQVDQPKSTTHHSDSEVCVCVCVFACVCNLVLCFSSQLCPVLLCVSFMCACTRMLLRRVDCVQPGMV